MVLNKTVLTVKRHVKLNKDQMEVRDMSVIKT